MKYLHIKICDAAANGDYTPAAKRAAVRRAQFAELATIEALVDSGRGWLSDKPLGGAAVANSYDRFRSVEISDAQAVRHARAAARLDRLAQHQGQL